MRYRIVGKILAVLTSASAKCYPFYFVCIVRCFLCACQLGTIMKLVQGGFGDPLTAFHLRVNAIGLNHIPSKYAGFFAVVDSFVLQFLVAFKIRHNFRCKEHRRTF